MQQSVEYNQKNKTPKLIAQKETLTDLKPNILFNKSEFSKTKRIFEY